MTTNKILVTGAAGFIGSNFVRLLIEQTNYKIIAYDKLTYAGNIDNLKDCFYDDRLFFVKGDICDIDLINNIVKDVDYIINFAAETHVDRSIDYPMDFINSNIVGVSVLANAARKYKVKKFIQISTDEVYGALGGTGFFTEDSNIRPSSPYSASKASADMLLLSYYKTYGFPIVITRCSNNYGPYQYPEKLIPLFIKNLLRNKSVPIYGEGKQVRDWIYVMDHCRAILSVLLQGKEGEVYNVGANNEISNIELTNVLIKILEKDKSFINFVKDRPGHDFRYAINANKIKKELKWEPCVDFKNGLRETVQWYMKKYKN
jgi:dTDP-glucose 4,6-dehydratase